MDQKKIGLFIASLRREKQLTQEQLGELLGVTNRTVSRWETGAYLPDLDKLQSLCAHLGISVNELLAGERICDSADFVKTADENLVASLAEHSPFGLQDRIAFYKHKWLREHRGTIFLCIALCCALPAAGLALQRPLLCALFPPAGLALYLWQRHRMMVYVEHRAFPPDGSLSRRPCNPPKDTIK